MPDANIRITFELPKSLLSVLASSASYFISPGVTAPTPFDESLELK